MGNCMGGASNLKHTDEDFPVTPSMKDSFAANNSEMNGSVDPQVNSVATGSVYAQRGYADSRANFPSMSPSFTEYNPRATNQSVTSNFTETVTHMTKSLTDYLPYNRDKAVAEVLYDVPEGCKVIDDSYKVDKLGTSYGLEAWRIESERFGLLCGKILLPDKAKATSKIDSEYESKAKDENYVPSASPEEIFENELKMLSYVQCSARANMPKTSSYRSKSPLKAGYEGEAFKFQHDNIIGFVGYMEARIDLSNAAIVERFLLTEFYVDTLRDHIDHRSQSGKKEMKHYEAALYAFQMAKGLLSLHRMKVCHRDLNPENIVMGLGLLDKEYKEWLRYVAREETRRTLETYAHLARGGATGSMRSGSNGQLNAEAQRQMQLQLQRKQQQQQQQQIHYYKFLQTQPLVAKIANFGNSKLIQQYRSKTRVGSLQFMAPEMMRGEEYDHACDIWSFGTILYEMISGKQPFLKKTNAYIENKVTTGKFPRADPIGSRGFDNLQGIMRNCLKTEPALRCSAKDLVEDLGKL